MAHMREIYENICVKIDYFVTYRGDFNTYFNVVANVA